VSPPEESEIARAQILLIAAMWGGPLCGARFFDGDRIRAFVGSRPVALFVHVVGYHRRAPFAVIHMRGGTYSRKGVGKFR